MWVSIGLAALIALSRQKVSDWNGKNASNSALGKAAEGMFHRQQRGVQPESGTPRNFLERDLIICSSTIVLGVHCAL